MTSHPIFKALLPWMLSVFVVSVCALLALTLDWDFRNVLLGAVLMLVCQLVTDTFYRGGS